MQIVIDIDENIYHRFINGFANENDAHFIEQLFKTGKVLPKGHGDLIDRDVALADFNDRCFSYEGSVLKYIPTVIPADK